MVAEKKDTGAGRFVFLEGGFGELFQKVRFKILGGSWAGFGVGLRNKLSS